MRRLIAVAVLLTSSLALSAAAQSTPAQPSAAPPTKVAVIAFQAAVGQTNEFQRNIAALQKKYEPKRQQLKGLNEEVQSLAKQLQAQGGKLSDAERASDTKTIDEKKKQLDRSAKDAQNDFQQEMQESFNDVASKVGDVMIAYAQQEGYTLVLDISQRKELPLVLLTNNSNNITKAVVDAYNVKSGVPAPPPAQPEHGSAPAKEKPQVPAAH